MTVSAIYTVHCQGARCCEWAGEEDTMRDALKEAKRQGFMRVRVPNGSMWDFCPKCYESYERNQS